MSCKHHHRHLEKVSRDLDLRAQAAIDEQQKELRFKRLSMDMLRECMQVLEKNTVAAELHDERHRRALLPGGRPGQGAGAEEGHGPGDVHADRPVGAAARHRQAARARLDPAQARPFHARRAGDHAEHCEHGWELIGEGGLAQLFVAQEIALNHHERWDGNGYPNRRRGNMIPLAARVTALADVYDALTHRRCYKEAWSVDDLAARDRLAARQAFRPRADRPVPGTDPSAAGQARRSGRLPGRRSAQERFHRRPRARCP